MSFQRGIDGPEPVRGDPVTRAGDVEEQRRRAASTKVASGSMACPRCDAPVLPAGPIAPAARIRCPYCAHSAAARDFLALGEPTRPARVEVHVRRRS